MHFPTKSRTITKSQKAAAIINGKKLLTLNGDTDITVSMPSFDFDKTVTATVNGTQRHLQIINGKNVEVTFTMTDLTYTFKGGFGLSSVAVCYQSGTLEGTIAGKPLKATYKDCNPIPELTIDGQSVDLLQALTAN